MRHPIFIVAALLVLATTLSAAWAAEKEERTRLTLKVLAESNSQSVADAHVVVRFVVEKPLRRDKRTSWEAKTNRKGVVVLDDIPYGAVKVQIIAKGFQTYGEQHDLRKADEQLTIRLQPPQKAVSSY